MPYITSAERIGIEKGIEEGEEKIILKQIKTRFPNLSPKQEDQIRALPAEQLEELAIALFDFKDLSDLTDWLAAP